jgi:hypothetical protein
MNYCMKALVASLAAAVIGACGGATDPAANAHVRFMTDAPFCSDPLPVNFFIDNVQVGRDTLYFGAGHDTVSSTPTLAFQRFISYQSFSVQAGTHTVRAAIVDTVAPFPPFVYDWPDTTLSVAAGAEVVRKLPFYCS